MKKDEKETSASSAYFKELAKTKPLSKEEEHDLAVKIQGGDERALNKLVQANLKFVVKLANKFIGMGVGIEDLIQEGNTGLIEAAKRFGPDHDVKFITYAQFWIRKRLNLCICEYGRTVRLPANQEYDIYKKKKAGGSGPKKDLKIDTLLSDENDGTIGDLLLRVDEENPFESEEQAKIIKFLLDQLNEKERRIVGMFYGLDTDPMSTKEVAEQMGLTAPEVNRALKSARKKMRDATKK